MAMYWDKYRLESTRWKIWDYSWPASYFITICTKDFKKLFGKITKDGIALSEIGNIVANEWLKTGVIRENVELDEWVVMPDHMHGIINIIETPQRGVCTKKKDSLGTIIGQFKSVCTKRIRKNVLACFNWHPSFYDRVIRNDSELNRIRKYIIDNPKKKAMSISRRNAMRP
jgi:putative transposase